MELDLVLRRVNRKRTPAPYDEADTGGAAASLYADQLRALADLCDLLGEWEYRWEGGDQGLALGVERIEVYSGETDSLHVPGESGHRVEEIDKLVGWITQWDAGSWEFVPCVPQLHWSTDRRRWVDRDTAVAENVKRSEAAREAEKAKADAAG